MKGSSSCSLVASVFAASTAALASSSSAAGGASFTPCCCEGMHSEKPYRRSAEANSTSAGGGANKDNKFAPRFDGLRFIETLVTAHR